MTRPILRNVSGALAERAPTSNLNSTRFFFPQGSKGTRGMSLSDVLPEVVIPPAISFNDPLLSCVSLSETILIDTKKL